MILVIFTLYESDSGVDDRSELFILISQGMLPWQSIIIVAKLPTPCTYSCFSEMKWDIATVMSALTA